MIQNFQLSRPRSPGCDLESGLDFPEFFRLNTFKMRPILAIVINTFMEIIRQPLYFILLAVGSVMILTLGNLYYFGFGDDASLVKNTCLAWIWMNGVFGSVFFASNAVGREIQTGAALTTLSKPISRITFILAKFVGVALALGLQSVLLTLNALLSSRMAFDAHGEPEWFALGLFFVAIALALLLSGYFNFSLGKPFTESATWNLTFAIVIAFLMINCMDRNQHWQAFGSGVDWRIAPAAFLVTLSIWVLAGLGVACSTRLDWIATLALCSGLFFAGIMSDYLLGRHVETSSWMRFLYGLTPNWQVFWMADTLETTSKTIPLTYILEAVRYAASYLCGALAIAVALFDKRELS